jgi:hypothetical protein
MQTKTTQAIKEALVKGIDGLDPKSWGYRAHVAKKYKVHRQRVTTIAAQLGLTAEHAVDRAAKVARKTKTL